MKRVKTSKTFFQTNYYYIKLITMINFNYKRDYCLNIETYTYTRSNRTHFVIIMFNKN